MSKYLYEAAIKGDAKGLATLLASGIDIDDKLFLSNMTCLYRAAHEGHANACSLLLEFGANINLIIGNRTALHVACEKGYVDVVTVLIKYKADLDIAGSDQKTPLAVAIDNNNTEIAIKLISVGASLNILFRTVERDDGMIERDRSPLHIAVLRRNVDIVQACLNAKADPNATTPDHGIAPLHFAAKLNDPIIATILIDAGANLDVSDQSGNTPLHYAAYDNRMDISRILLDRGAMTDKKNQDGKTPSDLALKYKYRDLLYMINTASYTQPLRDAMEALQDQVDEISQENAYMQKQLESNKQVGDALEIVLHTLMLDVHKYYNEFRETQGHTVLPNLDNDFIARAKDLIIAKELSRPSTTQANVSSTRRTTTTITANVNKLRAVLSANNTSLALSLLEKNDFCESVSDYLPDLLLEAIRLDNDEVALVMSVSRYTRVNSPIKSQINDTLLHIAIKLEKHGLIHALVSKGAYLNKKNSAGQTPASLYSSLVVRKRGIPGVRNLRELAPVDQLSRPDAPVCVACNTVPPEIQILPCGHKPICQACFMKKRPSQCPRDACRKNFTGFKVVETNDVTMLAQNTPGSPVSQNRSPLPLPPMQLCSAAIFTSCVKQSTSINSEMQRFSSAASTSSLNSPVDDESSVSSQSNRGSNSAKQTPGSANASTSSVNITRQPSGKPPMSFSLPPKMSASTTATNSSSNSLSVPTSNSGALLQTRPTSGSISVHRDSEEDRLSYSSKHSSENSITRSESIVSSTSSRAGIMRAPPPMDFVMPKYPGNGNTVTATKNSDVYEPSRIFADLPESTARENSISKSSNSSNSSNSVTSSGSLMSMRVVVAPTTKAPPMDFSMPRYVRPAASNPASPVVPTAANTVSPAELFLTTQASSARLPNPPPIPNPNGPKPPSTPHLAPQVSK